MFVIGNFWFVFITHPVVNQGQNLDISALKNTQPGTFAGASQPSRWMVTLADVHASMQRGVGHKCKKYFTVMPN